MLRILYAVAEESPFIKTGGLGDVAGALPKVLKDHHVDVRVVLPLYKQIHEKYGNQMTKLSEFTVHLGWREQYVGIMTLEFNGVTHYFIDNKFYFFRDQIYGEGDDGERFVYYSKVIAQLPKYIDFKPQIIHTNDWHTALTNVYVKEYAKYDSFYQEIKTVFTIHNLRYQGIFDSTMLEDTMDLPRTYYNEDGLKFYDNINFMKGGIVYSDAVNTVSESYAEEIKYPYFGEGLDGIIRKHENKISGIMNGIDYDVYNPGHDSHIHRNYDMRSISRKKDNKVHLQEKYGLPINPDIPMLSMVTRLNEMKGLDLIAHIFDELIQEDIQFVVLGIGDKKYEEMFCCFQDRYPEKVASRIYFNESESHEVYAASDIFVMPSKVEPCGLSQLIALKYGTVPVVRAIGGLKDSICPYNPSTGLGNGFIFEHFNAHGCLFAIKEALKLFEDKTVWDKLMKECMKSINDWNKSSKNYIGIYELVSNS